MAVREGEFSGPAYDTLAEGTVRGTISYVSQTFRENDKPNPTRDEDGELGRLLSRQYRAFKNSDPNPEQQKAIPVCVIAEVVKMRLTETQRATGQLAVGGFFFACRSCEYLKVSQAEKRRTDILRLRCIRFFKDGRKLHHDNLHLEYADCVSITFERQKKDERNDTVTQLSSEHASLCPPRQWAALVKRIRSYPGATDDTQVSAVWRNNRMEHITSVEMSNALRDAVIAIGEERLGFKAVQVGCHSIRSGAAMAMCLGECPVYTIMMIGRWSSDAFLRYIRKQVEQFSHNVSKRMLRFIFHRHIPDLEPEGLEPTVSHMDPRQRNHPDNAETRKNIGGNLSKRVRLSHVSLYL